MSMKTNKQTLRHKARLASADEWVKESGDGWEAISSSDDQANAGFVIAHFEGPDAKANREFVQAANPATVLALLDELEAKDAQIANLTAERDALREGVMGDAKHSNTRAAADIYFQLLEECEIPAGGSLVECVSDMREKLEAAERRNAELEAIALAEYANKRGFSFQHGSIHAHFGNGDVMVGSVTFENGDAGINFAPVREKIGRVGTDYEWTRGKTAEQVDSVFVIASSNIAGLEVIRNKLSDAIETLRAAATDKGNKYV